MNEPYVDNGWLIVPCDEVTTQKVQIGVSRLVGKQPEEWTDAYLDYREGQRVARILALGLSKRTTQVYLRVNGQVRKVGTVAGSAPY